jgi:hypothetical protein
MPHFLKVRNEQRRGRRGVFPTLHQRTSDPKQYRDTCLVIEMTRFNESASRDRGTRIEADEVSDLDSTSAYFGGIAHGFIQADLQRGFVPLQPAELGAMDVSGRFGGDDGSSNLAATASCVHRAVFALNRRPVVAADPRQLQPAVVLDLLDHGAEGVNVR